MYSKMRNTLASLAIVAAFIGSGVLFGEPAPASTARPIQTVEAQQAAIALALLQAAVSLAQAEAMAEVASDPVRNIEVEVARQPEAREKAKASSRLRLELGMPYYSFGAMLPRRRES